MTDFYKEFEEIAPNMGVDEIQTALNRLKNTWEKRLSSGRNEDDCYKMLGLIGDAYKAFADDTSRRKYDRELADSKAKPETADPNAERAQQYNHWYAEAEYYNNTYKDDLAKTAVEKALSFADPNAEEPDFYALVARIYRAEGDYTTALNYINKAIVINPNDAMLYVNKALTFEKQTEIVKMRESLNVALKKANETADNKLKAIVYGFAAYSWNFCANADTKRAEEYATKAVALGDVRGNGQRVLDDIKAKREASAKAARERQEYNEEQRRREEEARRQAQIIEDKRTAKRQAKRGVCIGVLATIAVVALGLLVARHPLWAVFCFDVVLGAIAFICARQIQERFNVPDMLLIVGIVVAYIAINVLIAYMLISTIGDSAATGVLIALPAFAVGYFLGYPLNSLWKD